MNEHREQREGAKQRHADMALNDWLMNDEAPLEKVREREGQIKLAIARVEAEEVTSKYTADELKQRYTKVLGVNWS